MTPDGRCPAVHGWQRARYGILPTPGRAQSRGWPRSPRPPWLLRKERAPELLALPDARKEAASGSLLLELPKGRPLTREIVVPPLLTAKYRFRRDLPLRALTVLFQLARRLWQIPDPPEQQLLSLVSCVHQAGPAVTPKRTRKADSRLHNWPAGVGSLSYWLLSVPELAALQTGYIAKRRH